MVEVINSPKTVKTRKEHLCNCCHRRFPKGSKMETQVCKYDEIYTWRTCDTCTKLLNKFSQCFEDPVLRCFPDGCVNDAPSSLFGGKRMEEFKEDPSPEHLLEMLNKYKEDYT